MGPNKCILNNINEWVSSPLFDEKWLLEEKFEDAKGVIISGKSKERQRNGQKKKNKITIYKSLHRKLRFEQQDEQEEARFRWNDDATPRPGSFIVQLGICCFTTSHSLLPSCVCLCVYMWTVVVMR
jgi:hypothetical protein